MPGSSPVWRKNSAAACVPPSEKYSAAAYVPPSEKYAFWRATENRPDESRDVGHLLSSLSSHRPKHPFEKPCRLSHIGMFGMRLLGKELIRSSFA